LHRLLNPADDAVLDLPVTRSAQVAPIFLICGIVSERQPSPNMIFVGA
jgi:hypothetical protein